MELTKKTLEIAFEALCERSRQLSEIARTGYAKSIREAADLEYKKTNVAWAEIEKKLIEINITDKKS